MTRNICPMAACPDVYNEVKEVQRIKPLLTVVVHDRIIVRSLIVRSRQLDESTEGVDLVLRP